MLNPTARKRLVVAIEELFATLAREEQLEVTKASAIAQLATRWVLVLENPERTKLADWLVEQDEVGELYADADALESRLQASLRDVSAPPRSQSADRKAASAHEPGLAQAILADPDDLDARAVYADWLLENGDPRGELMALQLARARGKKGTAKERAREKELLATHRRHFFGDLATEAEARKDRVHVKLENGFFNTARVSEEYALRKLLVLESARFLTSLEIECRVIGPIDDLLAARPLPAGLRSLKIALPSHIRAFGRTTCIGDIDLGRRLSALSHLRRLEVHATRIHIDSLAPMALSSLVLDAERFDLGSDAFATLTTLTELDLGAARINNLSAVRGLFRRSIPTLERLRLGSFADAELVADLLASSVSKSLKTLVIPAALGRFSRTDLEIIEERPPGAE